MTLNVKLWALLIFPSIHEGVSEALHPASVASHEYPRLGQDKVAAQEVLNNEIIIKESNGAKTAFKQSIQSPSSQSGQEKVGNRHENQGAGNIPRYVNLEPSLAMDWLEISWDDLRIKERIGAGKFSASPDASF